MGKRALRLILIPIGVLAIFGLLWWMWPSPISPAYWDEPEPPAMTGALAPNDALASARLFPVGTRGTAEAVAVSETGHVYFGTADGHLRKLIPGPGNDEAVIEDVVRVTRTRILGLDWLGPDLLGVTAISGLYAVDVASLDVTFVSAGAPAHPFGYANDLAATPDGRIFFTDSSTRWGHGSDGTGFYYDILENRPSGALYVWDPVTHQTHLVRARLFYPDGIELASDGRSLLIAEAYRYRIIRVWIAGPRTGDTEILADNLPGIPDGMHADGQGRLLVAMPSRRVAILRFLHRHPMIKQMLMKLPHWLLTAGSGQAQPFILVLDERTGEPLETWHDPDGRLCYLSNLDIAPDGTLWMGSADCGYVARYGSGQIAGQRNASPGPTALRPDRN